MSALEHPPAIAMPSPIPTVERAAIPNAARLQAGGVFAVAGKAMLGIAGAYLLRAVAESGSFPRSAVIGLALAYTAMWLVWSARLPIDARLASTAYAATASLILAPMLWELTLVFKVLSTTAAASVLSCFVAAAFALAWKRNLSPVVWVVAVTVILAALALLLSSRDVPPFAAAMLFSASISELAACRGRWLSLRPGVAVAVDLAIAILVYIYSRPQSTRPDYGAVSTLTLLTLPTALFLIYALSIGSRTAALRQRITVFEICQVAVSLILCALSVHAFSGNMGVLGISFLIFSSACYCAAFFRFDRIRDPRNYGVFSTWGAGLFCAGSVMVMPQLALALCLSLGAIVATVLGVRTTHLALEFHGLFFLTAAAWVAGLLGYGGRALAGAFPAVPSGIVWIVAVAAVLCYFIDRSGRGETWSDRLLQLLAAILAVSAVATFLVSALVWLAARGVAPATHYVAVIRTLITCALALALSFTGSRWQRIELVWMAYGALALVTAKLLFEDLQHGHPGSIAISLVLYAAALILVPRVARLGQNEKGAAHLA